MAQNSALAVTGLSGANSYQGFRSLVGRESVSYNNLYWVRFRSMPSVLGQRGGGWFNDFFAGGESGPGHDKSRLLTYYASDVTVPSRQLTTGEIKSVGAPWKYVTGTSFSEISISFILPRTYKTRTFFERWMNYASNDASQNVSWYDDMTTSYLDVFKYERGGQIPYDAASLTSLVNPSQFKTSTVSWNKCVGVWCMKNAFPFNISSMSLSSGSANYLSMEVSFYFERYRWYVPKNEGYDYTATQLGSAGTRSSQHQQGTANQLGVGPGGRTSTISASLPAAPIITTGPTPLPPPAKGP
ncbi:MAG: hypothetical protein O3C19_03915 [Bacteroidetes bacterium]|nr:hypothetical protein [Bacteroidota bacterium]